MQKPKLIVFLVGLMLLLLAAAMGYLPIKYLSAIVPVGSYESKGVYAFSPYQVLPVQVQNTGASGRERLPVNGPSPMGWGRRSWTRGPLWSGGRCPSPADSSHITVEPEQTAG